MEDVTDAAAGEDVALESGQEGINAATEVTEAQAEVEGLDTPSAEDAPESGQEGEDAEEGAEEAKKGDKKTFEERMAEMEAKLEAKLLAKAQQQVAERPDFIEVDMARVNEYAADTANRIEELKLEGRALEAIKLQKELDKLVEEIDSNEAKKAAYLQRQQSQQQQEQQTAQLNNLINQASELVAKENNIPADVWEKGQAFFMAERNTKPLLDAQYKEKLFSQGPVAAILWAKEYVEKNMGAGAKADQAAKNEGKQKLPAATGAVTVAGKEVKTWTQLMDLPSAEINKLARENPKQFQRLKDAHFK